MNLILDCSAYSGTALDQDIVAYAEINYAFVTEPKESWVDDSEYWQYEADAALEWMDGIARNAGYTYYTEDNCLWMDSYAELGA